MSEQPAWPEFSYAFQPIVDTVGRCVYSHEALIRGTAGQPAGWVLEQMVSAYAKANQFDKVLETGGVAVGEEVSITIDVELQQKKAAAK